MIYPTRRAIFLAALGIPLALLLAVIAPRLWLVGATWVIFVVGLMLLDALAAGGRGKLSITPALPHGMAVGQTARAAFALHFGGALWPRSAQVALDIGPRLALAPDRQDVDIVERSGQAEFALSVRRRGQGRFERLWVRWPGPIGLAWLQK